VTHTPERTELPAGLRRRRFTAPHRQRSLSLRLLRQFLIALVAVAVPVAVVGWVLTSPQFQLRTIELSGTERVPRQWIDARIAPLRGRHLLRLALADLESELAGHPWIAGVAMRKRLPDSLAVRVVERRPAALLRRADGLYYVDEAGRLIERFDPGAGPVDLLLVRATKADEEWIGAALGAAREFVRLEPAWGRELSEVEVLGEGDLRFHTAALPFALLLGVGSVEAGLRRVRRYLPEMQEHLPPATTMDLRFSGRIVAMPAPAARGERG
jgi:cell division septal protein FtsQ